jgi:hypothetical protein
VRADGPPTQSGPALLNIKRAGYMSKIKLGYYDAREGVWWVYAGQTPAHIVTEPYRVTHYLLHGFPDDSEQGVNEHERRRAKD